MTDDKRGTPASETTCASGPGATRAPGPAPARITLVYESRDKQLCLFEDAWGHLTAVRASRLA